MECLHDLPAKPERIGLLMCSLMGPSEWTRWSVITATIHLVAILAICTRAMREQTLEIWSNGTETGEPNGEHGSRRSSSISGLRLDHQGVERQPQSSRSSGWPLLDLASRALGLRLAESAYRSHRIDKHAPASSFEIAAREGRG